MDNVIQRKQSQTTLHDFLLINEFQLSIETMAIMIQRHENNKRWRMSKTILCSKDDIIKLCISYWYQNLTLIVIRKIKANS